MKAKYSITNKILQLLTAISEKLGATKALHLDRPALLWREKNRVKTIQASLALAGKVYTEQQIATLLEQKRRVGMEEAAQEIWNTLEAYQQLPTLTPYSKKSLLKTHQTLMQGLTELSGKWKKAPKGLAGELEDLLKYIQTGEDPILLKSCVVHYQLLSLQPFAEGNGKMGRLWQTLLLLQQYPVFEFLPVEVWLKEHQEEYDKLVASCDTEADCTPFIELLLESILEALQDLLSNQQRVATAQERLDYFITAFQGKKFSRKEYRAIFQDISSATASRDLKNGVEEKKLRKVGDKSLTSYQVIDGDSWRTAQELWENKEWRKGGVYELAMEVCSNKDKTPIETLAKALFELDFVQGPFDRDFEPATLDTQYFRSVGYLEVGKRQVPFVLFFISDEVEGGSNWLDVSIYTGMYEEALGEEQDTWLVHTQWNKELEALFAQMVQQLNAIYPIRLGLLGFEVSGLYDLQGLKDKELAEHVANPSTFFVNEGELLKGKNQEQVTFIGGF